MKTYLQHKDVMELAENTASDIGQYLDSQPWLTKLSVYPIPRGGVSAWYAIAPFLILNRVAVEPVDDPKSADIFVDDLIDSGRTMERYCEAHPGKPFFSLIDKRSTENLAHRKWVVFPWECKDTDNGVAETVEDNVTRILQYIGEKPEREGLRETPARVAKAWKHWAGGYSIDPAKLLKTFDDGAENYNQMIVVKDIPFYSHCEHHLAPFFGTATVAYIPDGKIVGLSKLSRLVDCFARRLQVQERMTQQICDAMKNHLSPLGCGVVVKARHMCMESRGICQQGHHTVTTALSGAMFDGPARAEFLKQA